MTIEKTIDITDERRLHLDMILPSWIPKGKTTVKVTLKEAKKRNGFSLFHRKSVMDYYGCLKDSPAFKDLDPVQYQKDLRDEWPEYSLPIDALKKEAAQKSAQRLSDPCGDALQRFCGSLSHIYTEDGVVTQRRMRDE